MLFFFFVLTLVSLADINSIATVLHQNDYIKQCNVYVGVCFGGAGGVLSFFSCLALFCKPIVSLLRAVSRKHYWALNVGRLSTSEVKR